MWVLSTPRPLHYACVAFSKNATPHPYLFRLNTGRAVEKYIIKMFPSPNPTPSSFRLNGGGRGCRGADMLTARTAGGRAAEHAVKTTFFTNVP